MSALSLTAYAKRRGVSTVAVSKAIAAGRLTESVVRDDRGKPKIADPELADREWEANTRPRVDRPATGPGPGAGEGDVPDYNDSRARREAHAARREAALADLAELDVAERNGDLVPVDEVRAYITNKFAVVKTRILGVPSRVAQRLPHVATEVVPVIESLLREALEELAAAFADVGDDEGEDE
ncbi:MAG: hypothetical protein ACTHU0_29030 [Kofleriaceae bacterium]